MISVYLQALCSDRQFIQDEEGGDNGSSMGKDIDFKERRIILEKTKNNQRKGGSHE